MNGNREIQKGRTARWRTWAVRWMLTPLLVLILAKSAAAESVREFLERKEQWPQLAKTKVRLRVEGRVLAYSRRLISFRNCDLPFRPEFRKTLQLNHRSGENIAVSGHLQENKGEIEFVVESLQNDGTDEAHYLQRSTGVGSTDFETWYELGEWAIERGRFYDDKELVEKGQEALLQGVEAERRARRNDGEALLKLEEKAGKLGLSARTRAELVFEGLRLVWGDTNRDDADAVNAFSRRLASKLSDTNEKRPAVPTRLAQAYRSNPERAYRQASDDERPVLHRLFFADVILRVLMLDLKQDESNGYAVADKIEELIPEHREQAESLRDRVLSREIPKVPRLTRGEMLQLRDRLEQRKRTGEAKGVVADWLDSRARNIPQGDVEEMVRIADDYIALLDDKTSAANWLIKAYDVAPDLDEIQIRLQRLDYVLQDDRWMTEEEFRSLPQDARKLAMREGRVEVDMTGEQIRKILGAPSRVTRIATRGRVTEIWSYAEVGFSGLAVRFERGAGEPVSRARAVDISQVRSFR